MPFAPLLEKLVVKLAKRVALDAADRASILALPCTRRIIEAPAYLAREGESRRHQCGFIVSGFAFRQKLTAAGARQIVSLQLPGDLLDMQRIFLARTDHNLQALTRLELVDIERDALEALVMSRPAIARALWMESLVEASILHEWILNIGRRDARARIAHLLCEFALRMDAATEIMPGGSYVLPMTQEQIGDAIGLTSVHVNRTLRLLEADGLVQREKRNLSFHDGERLRSVGDFNPLYLHLG